MVKASALFGDNAQNLKAWVMHSAVYHELVGAALTQGQGAFLFKYDNVAVTRDPVGRLFVVTDAPSLINPAGGYFTLGLVENGIFVEDNGDFRQTTLEVPGNENIQVTYQAEWSYNLNIKGYSWTAATGGASPTDTAISTGANWGLTATDNKLTAGVLLASR